MGRVGLGCMRLSTDLERDEARGLATITAALDGGVEWLDTARAYGQDAGDAGHNERLVARATGTHPRRGAVRLVTKCGMTRPDRAWVPDGRARTILSDARASMVALGRPPDVLLLHAPDPAVAFSTSLRALARAQGEGLAVAIGLSNVSRVHLDAVPEDVPIAAVEVALGAFDDAAARGGVLAWCARRSARSGPCALLAHSPLGGPARAARLARDRVLVAVAARHGVTPAEVVIAYLLAVDPLIVPLVGARRPDAAASAARAEAITLGAADLSALDERFPGLGARRAPLPRPAALAAAAEVVLVMGIAGSGKSRLAEGYVARGYERLNRDLIGGTLRGLALRLDERLAAGATRLVLDNTYISRASRSDVVRVAHRRGAIVRCVHVDTPGPEAQINCALRMLERHRALLGGPELAAAARRDPNLFAPGTLFRMERALERPDEDEGFASVERVAFVRDRAGGEEGLAAPLDLVVDPEAMVLRPRAAEVVARLPPGPLLLYAWRPGATAAWVSRALERGSEAAPGRPVRVGVCPHGAGPPLCWCRPPLPGLWLAFARELGIDGGAVVVTAADTAARTMARTLGVRIVAWPLPAG